MAPVRLAIIGMGGFAGSHHDAVLKLEEKRLARLVATCDPRRASFLPQREAWRFASRHVSVFEDHTSMLDACAGEIDAVLVPTPATLHPMMHAACVSRGLPVFLEKPGTLDPRVFSEMLRVEAGAKLPTAVGFNGIAEGSRRRLKERIVAGDFGNVKEVSLRVFWPRPKPYFTRAPWSSQLAYDNQLILDSCMGNAMAHLIHAALFFSGSGGMNTWALPEVVSAQLFRANNVPAPDTAFVQMRSADGVRLRLAGSHACHGRSEQNGRLVCEEATITFSAGQAAIATFNDGRRETMPIETRDPLYDNLCDFVEMVGGAKPRPATTLKDTWSILALNGLSYVSSLRIHSIPSSRLETARDPQEQLDYVVIPSLYRAAEAFLNDGTWPGETFGLSTLSPRPAAVADLDLLPAVISDQSRPE